MTEQYQVIHTGSTGSAGGSSDPQLSGELHYRITGSGGLCQQGAGRAGSGWDAPSLSSHPNGGEHHPL